MRKKALAERYGQLVDDRFLGNWNDAKAASLAQISAELDEMDSPKTALLRNELTRIEELVTGIEAKIAKNGPHRPQTKTAGAD